jgi:hypothetical protein
MTFLASGGALYNTMTHKGTLAKWLDDDVNSLLSPLLNCGFVWDANSDMLRRPTPTDHRKMVFSTPWCHAKGTPRKHCGMDHHITFNNFHIIHPRCLSCWKVVVTPKTFKQLCQLEVTEKNMNVASKCGIEMRDYTPKFYGGYFYNHSLEEGRERYEEVRKAVDQNLDNGKDVDVILKRGCTEYEMMKGPSVYWHNTKEESKMLEIIDGYVEVPRNQLRQSEIIKNSVRLKWALWAHMNGDMSYKELNGGESLFPDYVKYHEGDIEDIKKDLATAESSVRDHIPAPGLNIEGLKEVPEEIKGDDDRLT